MMFTVTSLSGQTSQTHPTILTRGPRKDYEQGMLITTYSIQHLIKTLRQNSSTSPMFSLTIQNTVQKFPKQGAEEVVQQLRGLASLSGLRFYSQHPHGGSRFLTLVPGALMFSSSGLQEQMCCTNIHAGKTSPGIID